jgi:hypothetical protein
MNYLQSLGLSKPQANMKPSNQKNPSTVQRNNSGVSQPSVPRSAQVPVQMLQAWISGGSVAMPKSRVAPKNAGKKMDFLG